MAFLQMNGQSIHYDYAGDSNFSKGAKILYIHGAGGNNMIWSKHLDYVAERHSPVSVDLPGHGQSEGDGAQAISEYSDFVVGFAKNLGWKKLVLAGHSMGGAVVLDMVLKNPEMVQGLILVCTGARLRVHPNILASMQRSVETGIVAKMDPGWAYSAKTSVNIIEETDAQMVHTRPAIRYGDYLCGDKFDVMKDLNKIKVPVLAICGEEDRMTPVKYHQYFKNNLPDCELHILKDCGHMVQVEQPGEFNARVGAFLNKI